MFLDILPPLMGLLLLAIFFVPGFKELLGALFVLVLWGLGLAVVALLVWAFWKHLKRAELRDQQFEEKSIRVVTPVPVSSQDQRPSSFDSRPWHNYEPPAPRLVWTGDLLSKLEWKRYEEVVAGYFRQLGYVAKTVRAGADGGVDVQLFKDGQAHPFMIVQCKAWDAYRVGVKPVRELFGVMAADKVDSGAFFTTGEFTTEAEDWARGKNLDLVNGAKFLAWIRQLTPTAQQELLHLATDGDYTTPTCPSCGVKMLHRTAGKGRSEGSSFWGCRNYPRCKQTFRITTAT